MWLGLCIGLLYSSFDKPESIVLINIYVVYLAVLFFLLMMCEMIMDDEKLYKQYSKHSQNFSVLLK